jgi:hypothetical protein
VLSFLTGAKLKEKNLMQFIGGLIKKYDKPLRSKKAQCNLLFAPKEIIRNTQKYCFTDGRNNRFF